MEVLGSRLQSGSRMRMSLHLDDLFLSWHLEVNGCSWFTHSSIIRRFSYGKGNIGRQVRNKITNEIRAKCVVTIVLPKCCFSRWIITSKNGRVVNRYIRRLFEYGPHANLHSNSSSYLSKNTLNLTVNRWIYKTIYTVKRITN